MKHLLIILISILLLSSPLFGQVEETLPVSGGKGVTLYEWITSSGGKIWKYFGDKDTHRVYKGEVENGVPNGLGIDTSPDGSKYVGEWKDGKIHGQGTLTLPDGQKYVGVWKDRNLWNGIKYDKNGNITKKYVNGKEIKQ